MKKRNELFEDFHSGIKIQRKLIQEKNFTYRNILGFLKPLTEGKRLKILDYGCGVGTIDFYLAAKGHFVVGLDVSKRAITACRESAGVIGVSRNTIFANINYRINFNPDIIICSEVIEHVPDYSRLLKKLSGFLKKGGYLFISTPTINAPLYRFGLAGEFDRRVGHLRRYDPNKLLQKVSDLGVEIISTRRTEGLLRNALFLYPWLGWIIRFLRGPLSDIVTVLDNLSITLFGESNFYILARKV